MLTNTNNNQNESNPMKAIITKIKTTNDSQPYKYIVGIEGVMTRWIKNSWVSKQNAKAHADKLQSDLNNGLISFLHLKKKGI